MAGIYIHIPFCRRKCYYCDFYKTLNTDKTGKFLTALKKEAWLRKSFLNDKPVKTIYFGGGTPSILNEGEIAFIMDSLNACFSILSDAEITFETNPDDLSQEYLHALKRLKINRLSIGIQSFNDEHLKQMNRRHNAQQAILSVENALSAGFTNLSTDLIYGLPGLTRQQWKQTLNTMFRYPVNHLSAYHLTYHEGTVFYSWLKKGLIKEIDESESFAQFKLLLAESAKAGFEHYEISNFARNGMYAQHNTAYWTGETYLGLGPSAHSFNGNSRRWNTASVDKYIAALENNRCFWEQEDLTEKEKFNEYILTRLRTRWGASFAEIRERFGEKSAVMFMKQAAGHLSSGLMKENNGIYTFTPEGLFLSDDLMAGFMII
jgi:putative oxygen-independent coproporphyrinogen III oxidase